MKKRLLAGLLGIAVVAVAALGVVLVVRVGRTAPAAQGGSSPAASGVEPVRSGDADRGKAPRSASPLPPRARRGGGAAAGAADAGRGPSLPIVEMPAGALPRYRFQRARTLSGYTLEELRYDHIAVPRGKIGTTPDRVEPPGKAEIKVSPTMERSWKLRILASLEGDVQRLKHSSDPEERELLASIKKQIADLESWVRENQIPASEIEEARRTPPPTPEEVEAMKATHRGSGQ